MLDLISAYTLIKSLPAGWLEWKELIGAKAKRNAAKAPRAEGTKKAAGKRGAREPPPRPVAQPPQKPPCAEIGPGAT